MSRFFRTDPVNGLRNLWMPSYWIAAKRGSDPALPGLPNKTYGFDCARSFAIYQGPLVRAILLLKFEQIEPLGAWFGERLAEVVENDRDRFAADIIVPVPLHRQRERELGYNQAALISKSLATRLRLPHKALLLMRTKARPDKRILTLEERWESVRGAFATRPGSPKLTIFASYW